jgi:hypothetical protein
MKDSPKTVGSKVAYKIMLLILKYIPITLACACILNTILAYLGITTLILNCCFGTSILFIGLLYILSYVFRFCYLYRLPLHYVTAVNGLLMIDFLIGLPITSLMLYKIIVIMTGLAIVIYIYTVIKNRNAPKTKTNVFKIYRWFGCMQLPTNHG